MAGTFFTDHHFSPRWTGARGDQHHPHGHHEEGHRRMSLDTLSRFLHAFQNQEGAAAAGHHHHASAPKVHPLFDLVEGPEDYKIYGDLPGLTSDDIRLDVNDHLFTISISGEFKVPGEVAALQDAVAVTHRDVEKPAPAEEEPKAAESAAAGDVAAPSEEKPEEKVEAAEPKAGEAPKKEGEEKKEEKEKTPEKEEEEELPKIKYHIQERKAGRFQRDFQFPIEVVVMEGVKAQCKNGLLSITVPKHPTPPTERKKGRKLDVE